MAFKSKITASIGVIASPSTISPIITAGTTATVIGLSLANTNSINIVASAKIYKNGGTSAFLVKDATILPGGTLVIVGGDQKLVLEEGDYIIGYCNTATSADAVLSYLAA